MYLYIYIYIFECKYTYVHKARERIHHVDTRRTCGENTFKAWGHIGVYIYIESICYTAENGMYFYYMGGDCQTAILDHDFTSSYC